MTKGSHGFYQGNIICDCPEMWVVQHGEKCASCNIGFKRTRIGNLRRKTEYCLYYHKDELGNYEYLVETD